MGPRRHRIQTALAIGLLLLGGVLINALAARHPLRVDLTADGRHTLAPITRELLAEAEGPIEIRAFLPSRIQPPYRRAARALRDTLAELDAAGDVRLRIHDPTDPGLGPDERAAMDEEAAGHGVEAVPVQLAEGDALVQRQVRFGVALLYRERQAVVAPIERPADAEYALTRALRAVVRDETRRPVIGVAAGHGEPDLVDSPVAALLEPLGEVQRVTLDGRPLPARIDLLLIVGPRQPFGERDRYVIDQHLMRGRALVALLDYRPPSTVFSDVLVPLETGLEPLLSAYGVEVDPSRTALDRTRALPAPIGRDANGRVITVNHPLFPRIRDLDPDHPVTRGLSSLAAPLAAPIAVERARGLGLDAHILARTGPDAATRTGVATLDPAKYAAPDAEAETPGAVPIAAAVAGQPPSAFRERPRPAPPEARGAPEPPFTDRGRGEARLAVITSGTRMLAAGENALVFLQNAVEWALTDGALTGLRARAAEDPPLEDTAAATRRLMRYGLTAGPTLLLLLFGGLRRWRRRR